jgi:FPC/CPF motif-containing protein YcgG
MHVEMIDSYERSSNDEGLITQFCQFVREQNFPCFGAKAALQKGQLEFVIAQDIRDDADDARVYAALYDFAKRAQADNVLFRSQAVLFRNPVILEDREFEQHLWARLQALTDLDTGQGQPYDQRVSADPANPQFSLSFGSEAFFAVGLHPGASRAARRFSHPAMVFNPHEQFEELRRQGLFENLRTRIRKKEFELSGSTNPMLKTFGEASEARQYSGRVVEDGWTCPFHRK